MPIRTPIVNWQQIRNYTEKFQWRDANTKLLTTGFNPPSGATEKTRVPYFVRFVTLQGVLEEGRVVTLKVDRRRHQRKVMFVASSEVRVINDYLIISIDGTRFVTT